MISIHQLSYFTPQPWVNTNYAYNLLIERKTVDDMVSSINDGRYKEQKARLLSSGFDITYIIEGDDICATKQMRNQTMLSSIYIHSMFRDGIRVIFTKNVQDTCTFILTLCAKMIENPDNFMKQDTSTNNEYIDCIKMKSKKIDNITPEVCYISQLAQTNTNNIYGTCKEYSKTLSNYDGLDESNGIIYW